MPHRPADSRLLSNLLSHEKDYVRSLHSQLDHGQASLTSFSAYAAASPPPASQAIGSVATVLVGAEDALRGYVLAVEEWCEQLKMLKDMEDEVGMIARDREILVDRLIKASKANNPKRRSLLPSSTSNNQGSPTFSGSTHALDQLTFSNSKLNLAQTELQACETHLTEKERMLAQMRESCIVGGLKMRCKALSECGMKWTELGKVGLQSLDASTSRESFNRPGLLTQKPLPDINYPYNRPSSDLSSSLAPSQSASQIFHPDVISDQYHPSASSSSGPHGTRAFVHAPEADIRDDSHSHFKLHLPPAHAISEEDHYTPPQARLAPRDEDEVGGSSLEEESAEQQRQYEVHENPLFARHPLASKPGKKLGAGPGSGSKTRLPPKKMKRVNSDSTARLPASASAPIPSSAKRSNEDNRFGTSSSERAYSDGHQDSPRRRKRSTFLGLGGALSNIFHRRDRSGSQASVEQHADTLSASPSKKEKWRTRTDKNLKKAVKGDESSDDDAGPASASVPVIPSYLVPAAEVRTQLGARSRQPAGKEGESTGGPKRKLRKTSDAAAGSGTQRKASEGEEGQVGRQSSGARKPDTTTTRVQSIGNGLTASGTPLSSTTVSRSSTLHSQTTVRSDTSARRPASLDLPSSSGTKAKRTGALSDAGHKGRGNTQRRRTSLGHVSSSPPTNGQMSLLSIVEDVTRQNRQNWLESNPNKLLVEVKAPKSVYETLNLDAPASSITSSQSQQIQSDVVGRRRGSLLRHQLVVNSDLRRNSLTASSSEPYLPLKRLPPTPAPKAPLRSALRNRSASPNPATMTPPQRSASPVRFGGTQTSQANGTSSLSRPLAERIDSAGSSVKDKDDDTASTISAYETGHEDFDSSPPTPNGVQQSPSPKQEQHPLPNGHVSDGVDANESHVSGSSTAGTATPPSRRKSVRVSLKPTFSPTPPALTDYEEERSPWAPGHPGKGKGEENHGWVAPQKTADVWEDSSDEDEEYSRAREMLTKASKKLEKVYRSR